MGEYEALLREIETALERGRLADMEPQLRAVVGMNPGESFAWALLTQIMLRTGRPAEAQACAENAVRTEPGNAQYLNLLGVAHAEQQHAKEAVAAFRKAIRAAPDSAEMHFNLGRLLYKGGNAKEAVQEFTRAHALDPRYPGAAHSLARALTSVGQAARALDLINRAAEAQRYDPWCAIERARVLEALSRQDEARVVLAEAADRIEGHAVLNHVHAMSLLAVGRFAEGWVVYQGRAAVGGTPRRILPRVFADRLDGQRILVHWEQGYGDILFFARFLPALRARGATVALTVPPALESLLARAGVADEVIVAAPVSPKGAEVLIGDLPHLTGAEDTPAPVRLAPLASKVDGGRARLAAAGPGPYLGVAWRAGAATRDGPDFARDLLSLAKQADVAALGRGLRAWPGTLVSIQRHADPAEVAQLAKASGRPVLDATDMNDDLESALGLLDLLDLYAGVSNTNVHLLAGLGRPAVILVPFAPEWRWMEAGDESPWFPGMRVVRQRPDDPGWAASLAGLPRALAAAASIPA